MSEDMRKWVVWYEDDTLPAVAVLAKDRRTASKIGENARHDEVVTAVVAEDEGADIPHDEKALSTLTSPKRFIKTVLCDHPTTELNTKRQDQNETNTKMDTTTIKDENDGEDFALKSDSSASDILDRDDLQ
jgi:hypothetical protein